MNLLTELKEIESDYYDGTVELVDGLNFSQSRTLRMVEFYSSSKYTGGQKDGQGREKPFYNIINTMVDTAVVATDIDTKDIVMEAKNEASYDKSLMFNHEIQNWMREADFAETLNKMGEVRARYGGVLIKKVEKDGDMTIEVVPWKNLVTDTVDIFASPIIEKHYLTPAEMLKKAEVWHDVDGAIALYSKKGYTRTDERIEVWEVEGYLPVDYLEEDAECKYASEYSLQRHFYCIKGDKSVHLFWEELKNSQYKYLPWKNVAGRALGRGVVEEGEEAQVWTNDSVQKEQAAMELASKIILKTNDDEIGDNVLTDMDNGSIVKLKQNGDINTVNLLNPSVMTEFQNLNDKWWSQYERATSSYDAIRGETPPSGQPYRLQALVSQAGSSHFDYRREEWGIFLREVFYDWVFPYVQKGLNKKHILASDFSPEELARLDEAFAKYEAGQYAADRILDGEPITAETYFQIQDQYREFIAQDGKRRFLDIPDGYYKDMEAQLMINITGEQKNKMAVLESLSNMLQSMVTLVPTGVVAPDDIKTVLNKIMEMSGAGISPLSIGKGGGQAQQQGAVQGQPQGQVGQQQPLAGNELKQLQPQANQ